MNAAVQQEMFDLDCEGSPAASFRIEAGKFYQTRDGRKVGPLTPFSGYTDKKWAFRGDWRTYTVEGAYEPDGRETPHDLVAEWVEDPPRCAQHLTDAEVQALVEQGPGKIYPARYDDLVGTTFAPLETLPPNTERANGIATRAAELVGGDRDRQHGAKHDNFTRIAAVWNGWLQARKDPAAPLDAHDVGVMMAFMKAARTQSGALNVDDYVDSCGYMACAGEVAQAAE